MTKEQLYALVDEYIKVNPLVVDTTKTRGADHRELVKRVIDFAEAAGQTLTDPLTFVTLVDNILTVSTFDNDHSVDLSPIADDKIIDLTVDETILTLSTTAEQYNVELSKSNVGLGDVDNTSDASKPVSTATQTALNAKANKVLTGYAKATTVASVAETDTVLIALGKLEKKADDAINNTVAYVQRAAPDAESNKIRFDKNAHYARTTSAITAAHFDSFANAVAGVTVRLQYYGTTAPVIPYGSFVISGAFIGGRENVIYITYVAQLYNTNNAATNGGLEFTISQY